MILANKSVEPITSLQFVLVVLFRIKLSIDIPCVQICDQKYVIAVPFFRILAIIHRLDIHQNCHIVRLWKNFFFLIFSDFSATKEMSLGKTWNKRIAADALLLSFCIFIWKHPHHSTSLHHLLNLKFFFYLRNSKPWITNSCKVTKSFGR